MRSKTIRLLIIVSTILVALITGIQLYWLNITYKYERKQFNIAITRMAKNTISYFNLSNHGDFSFEKNIILPIPEFYLVPVNKLPGFDSVRNFVRAELSEYNILTDCELLFFNAENKKYVAHSYIDVADVYKIAAINKFPAFIHDYNYLGFYFPHRNQYILHQMQKWIISSIILLMVLIGFGISVYYLYRQQFLHEVQKDFVNNFSHEFKTPLAIMKIAAEVIQKPTIANHPEKLANYTSIINQQVEHIQKQLNHLLMVAYYEHHRLKLTKESFNANELLQFAINSILPLAEQKSGSVVFENKAANSIINADKSYVLVSFTSLLENAVKYSVKPQITVSTFVEGNEFCVRITDKGVGIEKKHHKRIFSKFYRVTEGEVHFAKGFGLGLSFVKKITDAHHGQIVVKSRKGFGSTFILKFPVI